MLRQTPLDADRRTAATLAPALQATLRWCRQSHREPQFVSVADGPGSFTGLRIGVTTAKTLCYAMDLPLVRVDSLAAIAAAAFHEHPHVDALSVAIDAYRGQCFCGSFRRDRLLPPLAAVPPGWDADGSAVRVLSAADWAGWRERLSATDPIAGDAKPFAELAGRRLPRRCDAVGVGLLGIRAAAAGAFIDPLALVPRYLKSSAAEELAGEGNALEPA